ncbi:hypothetical protein HG537_0A05770 [Torulaspora globosa]|uniref:Extracellular mutant protein 11 C-terminal domain-containing protein n=1 Tax=Torulaspora globosa TaxID=48254 RepID=A0A7H9HLX1_9SACH|nr:hypothetical protein HG537_0A05770 [Torulaspora sp. CBS 2947]
MTLIKSEPNTDSSISLLDGKASGIQKTKELADSRPALGSKKVNVVSGKKESGKDLSKFKFEEFLLNAGGARQSNLGFDKGLIKKEAEIGKNESVSDYSTPVKRTIAVEESTERKKLKKVATQSEVQDIEVVGKPLKTPGPYRPITEMLYESSSKSLNESEAPLFQDLEQESERKFCREAAQWSLDEWISQGQMLLNAHTSLVGQLVRERIELSGKFRAITSVINDRAEALNRQGQLLDEKLKKIENLGKEILDII